MVEMTNISPESALIQKRRVFSKFFFSSPFKAIYLHKREEITGKNEVV